MAISSPSLSIGKLVGITLGGSAVFIIFAAFIVGVIVISLIPFYTSTTNINVAEETYKINGLVIRGTFANLGFNFTGGQVLNRGTLADICTQIFRSQNIRDFHACVVTNLVAFGPSNSTDLLLNRKRRTINDATIYEVAYISLLFKYPCGSRSNFYDTWSFLLRGARNNSCISRRISYCQQFVNSRQLWTPFPKAYTQLIVGNGTTNCASIALSNVRNLAPENYAGVAIRFNTTVTSENPGYCSLGSTMTPAEVQNFVQMNSDINSDIQGVNTCTNIG